MSGLGHEHRLCRSYAGLKEGIGISLAICRRSWAVAARMNSSRGRFGARKRNRSSLRMTLEVREQHLDLLAEPARGASLPRFCDLARHVTGAFIDPSRHVSSRLRHRHLPPKKGEKCYPVRSVTYHLC